MEELILLHQSKNIIPNYVRIPFKLDFLNFNFEFPNSCINDELERVFCVIFNPNEDYEQESLKSLLIEGDTEENKDDTKIGI